MPPFESDSTSDSPPSSLNSSTPPLTRTERDISIHTLFLLDDDAYLSQELGVIASGSFVEDLWLAWKLQW